MEVIRPGYEYKLHNLSGDDEGVVIRFVEKKDGKIIHGVSNEEVFSMMLHRFYFLQKEKSYSKENSIIIVLLTQIKDLLKQRLDRKLEYVNRKKMEKQNEETTACN